MTITQIAQQVLAEHSAVYVRYRSGGHGEPKEYDSKPLFMGSRKGWTVLDATTAAAIMVVFRGLKPELQAKVDTIPLARLVEFCWRVAA